MAEILTIDEIERRFPDEWIFVAEPVTGPQLNVLSGEVVTHSKDREEVYQVAFKLRPKRSAIWFNVDPSTPETVEILSPFFDD